MKQVSVLSRALCAVAFTIAAASAIASFPQQTLARDGISGCTVQRVGTDFNPQWKHTIHLHVPEGSNCKVYIWNDHPGSGWQYCWNKSSARNPVVDTCTDVVNTPSFTGWKAKAVCGDKTFVESCRR